MVISRISAITTSSQIRAISRVRPVERRADVDATSDVEEFDEIVLIRKDRRPPRPGKDAISGGRSPAGRSSAAVQDQLNLLRLGG